MTRLDFILEEQFCTEQEAARAQSFCALLERARASVAAELPYSPDQDEAPW